MGNDAPDASATTATPRGQEHEGASQSGQMVPWVRAESETNGVGSRGVLRATSGNATKRLKTRSITRAGKSSQAITMKQIATEERQAEKGKMKEWKENIMQEVARELHVIRQIHEGAMEAQRQSFQLELERMGGKVEQLESEVKALKVRGRQLARKTPLAKAVAPSGSDGQEERERGSDGAVRGSRQKPETPADQYAYNKVKHTEPAKTKRQTNSKKLRSDSFNKCNSKLIGESLDRGQTQQPKAKK